MARVLVVEDDDDVRTLIVGRLERSGHQVHGTGDAAEANTLVEAKGPPDLVVLDVNMPRVSGFELLTMLRESTGRADLPAIFLTGRTQLDDISTGRGLGALYLTKPFMASALINAVDALLGASSDVDHDGLPSQW